MRAGEVRGELKATADFDHGENVRNRESFGEPEANRSYVFKPPLTDGTVPDRV